MVAANKFEDFVNRLGIGKVHDLSADTLEVYLSNATIHIDPATASGETHHRIAEHVHDGLPAHSH